MYRPPNSPRPLYEEGRERALEDNREEHITTLAAGDLKVNSWKSGYGNWLQGEELRELPDPSKPTHESGTVGDAMEMAVGKYMPEGVLPRGAGTETETSAAE